MQTAERRRTPRVPSKGEPPRTQLTSVIVGAYHELPGLNLTSIRRPGCSVFATTRAASCSTI